MQKNDMDSVRERLIIAGKKELEERGAKDFSLRRVALAAGVSCAAPYRHFADKEELIRAIVAYVREGFEMLLEQISTAFADRPGEALCEALTAGVRFWTANGDFRSILLYGDGDNDIESFNRPLRRIALNYAASLGASCEESENIVFRTLSSFYGTLLLVFSSSVSLDEALYRIRKEIL